MTYKHLKYIHDLAFGRQSCLQRVRKFSVKVWHIPESYNFVCGCNVPLDYLFSSTSFIVGNSFFFRPLLDFITSELTSFSVLFN